MLGGSNTSAITTALRMRLPVSTDAGRYDQHGCSVCARVWCRGDAYCPSPPPAAPKPSGDALWPERCPATATPPNYAATTPCTCNYLCLEVRSDEAETAGSCMLERDAKVKPGAHAAASRSTLHQSQAETPSSSSRPANYPPTRRAYATTGIERCGATMSRRLRCVCHSAVS